MYHAWVLRKTHAGFWPENLEGRGSLEDSEIDGRIILKWILHK
jgi:hypothetical protein